MTGRLRGKRCLIVGGTGGLGLAAAARFLDEGASLVLAGLSNHQVADRLFVSVRTVDGHLYRIFAKLDISSRDQLIHLLRLDQSGA